MRQEGRRSGGNGGRIKWKSFEVITRAVSRGQNELRGEFKMSAGDVVSRLWNTCTFQQKLRGSS